MARTSDAGAVGSLRRYSPNWRPQNGVGVQFSGRFGQRNLPTCHQPPPCLAGLGTAPVYLTLLAAIGDVAHPSWRASAVGVYRPWRDLGYAVGALVAGLVADGFGLAAAVWLVAVITLLSGVVTAVRMRETLARGRNPAG